VSWLADRRFIALLRVVLGVVFIAAALPKLADPIGFAKAVANYRMLPELPERLLALLLPPVELLVGVCLILGVLDAGASLLALLMMLMFIVGVGAAVARGLDISCGCFDTEGGTRVGVKKLLENILLAAMALRVWTGDRSWLSLSARRWSPALLGLALLVGAAPTSDNAAAPGDSETVPSSRPFLWLIEREPPSFLFGTIHLQDPQVTALPGVVEEAFAAADILTTEVPLDLGSLEKVAAQCRLAEGETLAELLPPEVRERVDRYLAAKGYRLEQFDDLEIYAFAFELPLLDYRDAGPLGLPLDLDLYLRAGREGKETASLESVEDQIGIFESMSQAEQLEFLGLTLAELEKARNEGRDPVAELIDAYRSGDPARLWRLFTEQFDLEREFDRKMLDRLLVQRNGVMAAGIARALNEQPAKVQFFAVGAAHYLEEDGILARLRAHGFALRRLAAADTTRLRQLLASN
jgi:uncharacterized protein YbaP (TraB family)/uncharacterized membrane protein YphA (DoxX/SURF4 family)